MSALLIVLGVILVIGWLAYLWMKVQGWQADEGFEGIKRNPDTGEWMIDGFAIIGDLYPLVSVTSVACWSTGETCERVDAMTGYTRRAVALEWLGHGVALVFGRVVRR